MKSVEMPLSKYAILLKHGYLKTKDNVVFRLENEKISVYYKDTSNIALLIKDNLAIAMDNSTTVNISLTDTLRGIDFVHIEIAKITMYDFVHKDTSIVDCIYESPIYKDNIGLLKIGMIAVNKKDTFIGRIKIVGISSDAHAMIAEDAICTFIDLNTQKYYHLDMVNFVNTYISAEYIKMEETKND